MPSDSEERYRNFWATVPEWNEYPLTANQITIRQAKPRLSRKDTYGYLHFLAAAGEIELVDVGCGLYYRKLRPTGRALALPRVQGYTRNARNKFSLDANVDRFLQYLAPLREGKAVKLLMDTPPKGVSKKRMKSKQRLLIICLGSQIGLPPRTVLISVIGHGAILYRIDDPPKLANLVLAGVPAILAKELTNKIRQATEGVF